MPVKFPIWCETCQSAMTTPQTTTLTEDVDEPNGGMTYYYLIYECPKCGIKVRFYKFGGKP